MAGEQRNCICGESDCWGMDDNAWLDAGWGGVINGCSSSVFFIHGKRIREQRHIPEGNWPITEMLELVNHWAEGLPGSRLVMCADTGAGDPGFWIEGERDPNAEDLKRLEECRARRDRDDRRDYERLQRKFGSDAP